MSWQERVARALGSPVRRVAAVQGGDLSQVFRVDLEDGRRTAVKLGPHVAAEARMLRAMARTGAAVPDVVWGDAGLLCLEWLHETRAGPDGWRALGETLRKLHAAHGTAYGWTEDHAFGPVAIDNRPTGTWPAFWAERRLLPLADRLPGDLARRVSRLARDLPDRLPEAPAPALLHGDLWTGNALFSGPRAFLIDPACYHGHAEVDLAMLTLFGRPDGAFWSARGVPDSGWSSRRPIYQLWPALVHHALFGAGYRGMVAGLLDQAGV